MPYHTPAPSPEMKVTEVQGNNKSHHCKGSGSGPAGEDWTSLKMPSCTQHPKNSL